MTEALNLMVKDIESQNLEVLEDWDGNPDSIEGIKESVEKLVQGDY